MRWFLCAAFCAGVMLAGGSSVFGDEYALLIGIGDYPGIDADLEGPPNDVRILKDRLIRRFGIPENRIETLVNGQAVKSRILSELDRLYNRSSDGDYLFIYYSGHGTGYYDPKIRGEIEIDTGALVPYDINTKKGIEEVLNTLLIGKRDLQPRFSRMDQDRLLFVAFDACFSENTVRSALKRFVTKRFYPLPRIRKRGAITPPGLEDLTGVKAPDEIKVVAKSPAPFPYQNIFYLSAAARDEPAFDVTTLEIRSRRYQTVDGRPHGAMTDVLIRGLDGGADTDGDRRITPREVARFVQTNVSEHFDQTPQFLYSKTGTDLADAPLFNRSLQVQAAPSTGEKPGGASSVLAVRLEYLTADLTRRIQSISGVRLTREETFDLLIRSADDEYHMYLPSGAFLWKSDTESALIERVKRQCRVRKLVKLSYPRQPFNIFLELIDNKGVYLEGETIGFRIHPQARCRILLINVETGGAVNVIYPYYERELAPLSANQDVSMPDFGAVTGPRFGVEYLKVFAFSDNHPILKSLMGKSFPPESPLFTALMDVVDTTGAGIAQSTVQINTWARSALTGQ